MTRSIEEIVAKAEQGWAIGNGDTLRLIASWRDRGEALEQVAYSPSWVKLRTNELHKQYEALRELARAALAAEPASGEDRGNE